MNENEQQGAVLSEVVVQLNDGDKYSRTGHIEVNPNSPPWLIVLDHDKREVSAFHINTVSSWYTKLLLVQAPG